MDEDGQATGSDHVVIEWKWTRPGPLGEQGRRFTGWALRGRLGKEKEEDWPPEKPRLADLWALRTGERPILGQEATVEDLEDEIEYVQDTMRTFLDANVKRITICSRSKQWWSEEIQDKRKQLRCILRRKRTSRASQAAAKEARKSLRSIRRAMRLCWEEFLNKAYEEDMWKTSGYISPREAAAVPTITHQGETAATHEEKARMLAEISFPPPVPYEGGEGQPGPPGQAFTLADNACVERAFRRTTKKSPGPDGIGPLALRCLFLEWDTARVEALVRANIRLGVHPARWKLARGVIIPKPGNDDYSVAKACRRISLLNCLGEIVECNG